jgi:hypothetical protein
MMRDTSAQEMALLDALTDLLARWAIRRAKEKPPGNGTGGRNDTDAPGREEAMSYGI